MPIQSGTGFESRCRFCQRIGNQGIPIVYSHQAVNASSIFLSPLYKLHNTLRPFLVRSDDESYRRNWYSWFAVDLHNLPDQFLMRKRTQ